MKTIFLIVAALFLTACAQVDPNYVAYANIKKAEADAQAARYNAISRIGESGDPNAKAMAVMALALSGGGGGSTSSAAAPAQGNSVLSWVQALSPLAGNWITAYYTTRSAITQSDNSVLMNASSNNVLTTAFSKIQAPGAVTTTNNTLSGTGTMGGGSYATTDSHNSTDNHAVDSHLVNPAPVVIQPVSITPGTKICTDVAGVITCQ